MSLIALTMERAALDFALQFFVEEEDNIKRFHYWNLAIELEDSKFYIYSEYKGSRLEIQPHSVVDIVTSATGFKPTEM